MNPVNDNRADEFFVTGGTMMPDAPSYVERQADQDLFDSLVEGKYAYVLTARQMGKSSLTARTAEKLRKAGVGAVVIDLTAIGQNVSIEQWYVTALSYFEKLVELPEGELARFWQSQPLLSPVQRWMRAIREIVLSRRQEPVVVFVDEVDSVLNLPFPADEFFAAIRECYNLRAEDREMRRLTFCLAGAATPSSLIRDKRTTPFNIGQRIELHDFTAAEAEPLTRGLRREELLSLSLLERILHWSGGHPFLTQRLCQAVANDPSVNTEGDVDRLCRELFLTSHALDNDDNLLFVQDRLLRSEHDKAALLDLYAKVRKGKRVPDDNANPLAGALRLSGVTRAEKNHLKVRNRIYERVFDEAWIEKQLPDAERRRQQAAYRRGLLRAGLIGAVILSLAVALALNEIRRQKNVRQTAQRLVAAVQLHVSQEEIENAADAEELIRRVAYKNQIKQAQEAWEEANISRVDELLRQYIPRKAGEADLRGFEWHYLWQLSHQEIREWTLRHQIAAVQMAPDGRRLAVVESFPSEGDKKSRYVFGMLDLERTEKTNLFETQTRGIFDRVAFTPDLRKVLVDSGEQTAAVLDANTGVREKVFHGFDQPVRAASFSHDGGRAVLGDLRGTLRFWEHGKELKIVQTEREIIWVDLSRDGKRVVTASGTNVVKIHEFSTGRELASLDAKEMALTAAAFVPNGNRLLTAAKDGTMQIWEMGARAIRAQMQGHSGPIQVMVFSPNGATLATGSEDRTVKVWEVETGRLLVTLKGHGSAITAVCWSVDGKRLVTGGADFQVKVWDVERTIGEASAFGSSVNKLRTASCWATTFSGDDGLLAIAQTGEGKLKVVQIPSGKELKTLNEPRAQLLGNAMIFAIFSRGGKRAAVGRTGAGVTIWDVSGNQEPIRLPSPPGGRYVYAAAFSPDGTQLAFVFDDRTVKVWSATTGEERLSLVASTTLSYPIAYSRDGKRLAAGGTNGEIILWDLATSQSVAYKEHDGAVRMIAFSPDGATLMTAGRDNNVRLWEAATGRKLRELGQTDLLNRAAFSPDGKRAVTGSLEGTIKIWDLITGQELMILDKHTNQVTSINFSNNGNSLVTSGEDGLVKLWRIDDPPGRP